MCGVVLAVAACTGGEPGDAGTDPGEPAEPVSLTLLTHDSFDASKKVLDDFTEETGIEVRVVPAGDAGQLVNRAILSAGNPEGDVLFGVDNNLLDERARRGRVHRRTSPIVWKRSTIPWSWIPNIG